MEPPGGTFRCEILHGFTLRSDEEIETIAKEASHKFQGTSYNILMYNCNHFTSYLVEKLTGKTAPAWLNRAASVGLALPCVVPKEWIEPPDHATAEGELLDEEEEDERAGMLRDERQKQQNSNVVEPGRSESNKERNSEDRRMRDRLQMGSRVTSARDTGGRYLPTSERAPLPSR